MAQRFDRLANDLESFTGKSGAIIPPPEEDDDVVAESPVEEVPFEETKPLPVPQEAPAEQVSAPAAAKSIAPVPEVAHPAKEEAAPMGVKKERGRPRKKEIVLDNNGKRMKKTIIDLNEDVHAYLEDRAAMYKTTKKAYIERLVMIDVEKHFDTWDKRVKEAQKILAEADM